MKHLGKTLAVLFSLFIIVLIVNAFGQDAHHKCNIHNCEGVLGSKGFPKKNCTIHSKECTQQDFEFWCILHSH